MQTAAEKWAFSLTLREDPGSEDCVKHALSLTKLVRDSQGVTTNTVLFVAGVIGLAWNRWPDQIQKWSSEYLVEVDKFDRRRRGMLYLALGLCPHANALIALQEIHKNAVDQVDANEVGSGIVMHGKEMTVFVPTEPLHLDMLLGCFFGSGDARYLRQICSTILWLGDENAGAHRRRLATAAHRHVYTHLGRNHFGVLTAMEFVHAELPDLADLLEEISDEMEEAALDLHTH